MTNFNILKLEKLQSFNFVISNNVSHIKTKIWNLANIISPFSWMMTLLSILIIILFARISQITLCKLGLKKNVTVELTLIPFRYIVKPSITQTGHLYLGFQFLKYLCLLSFLKKDFL